MIQSTPYARASHLRIAMLSIHSSPTGPLGTSHTGGMSVYVRELSRWLGAAGHRVDIFTCAGPSRSEERLYPNVRLVHLGRPCAMHARDNWPDLLPRVFDRLEAYVCRKGTGYDIIHSHYWLSGVVGAMAQARWRRPHVTMFHTLGAVKNATRTGESESRIRIAHEQWLAMAADRIIVAAQRERDNLTRLYHARRTHISVIPCGVNLDLFRPSDRFSQRGRLGLPPDADIVLYVGRFAPLKGLERLLEAVERLRARFPKILLLLVGGDGPHAPASRNLSALAGRLGIGDAVRFMGRVDQTELPPFYAAADLLALPSHYESFGLVVLEALASGTPVVASPVGAVEAIIQEGLNGTIIEAGGNGSLAEGIARILCRSSGGGLRTRRIRKTAEAYDWPRVAAAVDHVYAALLEGHDPAQSPPLFAPCTGSGS